MHAACYTIKSSNGGLESNQLLIEAIRYFIKIADFEKLAQNEGNQIPIFDYVSFLKKSSFSSFPHSIYLTINKWSNNIRFLNH